MFGSLIIVFREVLEASLIIGLVMAATTGLLGRGFWVSLGVGVGLLGACVVAYFAESLSVLAQGAGQELFNATVLTLAVGMLAWHQIWMGKHGAEMSAAFKSMGHSLRAGRSSMQALAVVVASAILREGSEAVLFLYGVASGADVSTAELAAGAGLGLLLGGACGAALYFGLLRIPARRLFDVTGWLITLLAAAMASQAASFLVQAGYLPTLIDEVWDSSRLLSLGSTAGQLLHMLVGYEDRPNGIQIVLYLATAGAIWSLSRWVKGSQRPTSGSGIRT